MGFNAVLTYAIPYFGANLATVRGQHRSTHSLLLEVWSNSPTLEVIEAAMWQRHIEGGGNAK